jgi:hypothetical protein
MDDHNQSMITADLIQQMATKVDQFIKRQSYPFSQHSEDWFKQMSCTVGGSDFPKIVRNKKTQEELMHEKAIAQKAIIQKKGLKNTWNKACGWGSLFESANRIYVQAHLGISKIHGIDACIQGDKGI